MAALSLRFVWRARLDDDTSVPLDLDGLGSPDAHVRSRQAQQCCRVFVHGADPSALDPTARVCNLGTVTRGPLAHHEDELRTVPKRIAYGAASRSGLKSIVPLTAGPNRRP